jgi:hypothetical protein
VLYKVFCERDTRWQSPRVAQVCVCVCVCVVTVYNIVVTVCVNVFTVHESVVTTERVGGGSPHGWHRYVICSQHYVMHYAYVFAAIQNVIHMCLCVCLSS